LNPPLIVLDTMVIVAAVSGNPEGASAMAVRAIASGEATLAISDDYLSELVRVMGYPAIEERIERPVRAFETALDVGAMGVMYHPRRLDWPTLRDVGDNWVFDLAYESGADYIVTIDRDIRDAASELGFNAIYLEDLLETLRRHYER
jgi:putative PIN family toxin of toxin-antitoxin system